MRCRLVASWGWSRSQGLGCSPIKAVRELGLERRETVNTTALSLNPAKCWELRTDPEALSVTPERNVRRVELSNRPSGGWLEAMPDDQQERLDDYVAGYVDGKEAST